MKAIGLNDNRSIPTVGFGTWRIPLDRAADLVEAAIKAGYRHIDCAMVYENETAVGEGISRAIASGAVQREDLFATSKLWNTDHAAERVVEACRRTLRDLQLDYLDLYLVHWGVGFEHGGDPEPLDENGAAKLSFVPLQETWRAMEKLVDEGLVKSIGVSNFTAPMLIDLLSYAKTKPVMNQIELHPYHAQSDLVKFCQNQGVAVTAYSPLGSTGAPVADDPTVRRIAEQRGISPAQVLLQWAVDRGTAVIPKTTNLDHVRQNLDLEGIKLTQDDIEAINALDRRKIIVNPIEWWGIPYF